MPTKNVVKTPTPKPRRGGRLRPWRRVRRGSAEDRALRDYWQAEGRYSDRRKLCLRMLRDSVAAGHLPTPGLAKTIVTIADALIAALGPEPVRPVRS